MKRFVLISLLAACGGKTSPGPAAFSPLCIDPAAPGGEPFDLYHEEDRPGLVADGDDKGVAVENNGVAYGVVTRSDCGPSPCDAQLVMVENGTVVQRRLGR